MDRKNDISGKIPPKEENPFRVPDRYFGELYGNVMDRIGTENPQGEEVSVTQKRISLRPYISLAASITGIALVVYILLQTVVGSRLDEQAAYDIELLENYGIMQDEWMLKESYEQETNQEYSEWEQDAILYLSSNEVDLEYLIDSN